MPLEKVCKIFSTYEGVEYLVGVDGQTISCGGNESSTADYAVWEGAFGIIRVTIGRFDVVIRSKLRLIST